LHARPSSPARQFASLMLILSELKVWLTWARIPGLFWVITLTCTGRVMRARASQATSMRRSGSLSNALVQSRR
jgi:hypothetical protein